MGQNACENIPPRLFVGEAQHKRVTSLFHGCEIDSKCLVRPPFFINRRLHGRLGNNHFLNLMGDAFMTVQRDMLSSSINNLGLEVTAKAAYVVFVMLHAHFEQPPMPSRNLANFCSWCTASPWRSGSSRVPSEWLEF